VKLLGNFGAEERLEAMVGCAAARRLFMLHSGGSLDTDTIRRVNPNSGQVEKAWSIEPASQALSVACNDQLLVTIDDRVEQYDTDGNLIRVFGTGLEHRYTVHESLLLPDSTYDHPTVCRFVRIIKFPPATYCVAGIKN